MTLDTEDIQKINELLTFQTNELRKEMYNNLASKQDLLELKDELVAIRRELDTEHEIRRGRIESNTKRIDHLYQEVGSIKEKLAIR